MMKRYDSYKDSGIEWIGEIPEDWEVTKIKYLVIGEDTLLLDGDWIESKDIVFDSNNIKYITTGNIGAGFYKEQGNGFITTETFEKLNCTEVFEGDLLISRLNAPIGRACILPNLNKRVVTSVDNVILRPNQNYNKRFLVHLMSNDRYFEHTSLIARGATMQRISRSLLADIKICVPPINEQSVIANFLDDKTSQINILIQKKLHMIALLEEEKTVVINEAVTKGLNSDAPMKDGGIEWLGRFPAHWQVKKLKYLVSLINKNISTEGISNRIALESIESNSGRLLEGELSFDFNGDGSHFINGDVLFSKLRPYLAKVYLALDEGVAAGELLIFRPKEEILSEFLFYRILSSDFIKEVNSSTYGSKMPRASWSFIEQLLIPIPSLNEQREIIQLIKDASNRIESVKAKALKEIHLLQEYRTAMISEAVTGKMDLRNYQPEPINSQALELA